jgi:hypothetical protein
VDGLVLTGTQTVPTEIRSGKKHENDLIPKLIPENILINLN